MCKATFSPDGHLVTISADSTEAFRFPEVPDTDAVEIREGEVHAVCGEEYCPNHVILQTECGVTLLMDEDQYERDVEGRQGHIEIDLDLVAISGTLS